jgi:hypothetical protein
MALFWIFHEHGGEKLVFIAEAEFEIAARIKSAQLSVPGTFVEAQELDARTAKRIPRSMIYRMLTQAEA